jgi:hypothetical protein
MMWSVVNRTLTAQEVNGAAQNSGWRQAGRPFWNWLEAENGSTPWQLGSAVEYFGYGGNGCLDRTPL